MKNKEKGLYETPATTVVEIKAETAILQASQVNQTRRAGKSDYIPEEW